MKVQLIERGKCLNELTLDSDEILAEAEKLGIHIFKEAIIIFDKIVDDSIPNYQISDHSKPEVEKYLRKSAANGDTNEIIRIQVEKMEGASKNMNETLNTNFEEIVLFPHKGHQQRYDRLVGLDDLKTYIEKEATVLIAPELLESWSKKFHQGRIGALGSFRDRYPFFIFEGDVGTGKTEFAETFGSSLAQAIGKNVRLARLSMKTRGNGMVGEMSKLISKAFQDALKLAAESKTPVILLLDEADSLAQSREESQMHHEDRAGVNALIQGIDHIRNSPIPILVVFCTNRVQALDPAIRRRAAIVHTFSRPNKEQRLDVFRKYLSEIKMTPEQLNKLVELTGETASRGYSFTYSDLFTRLIPQAILNAYPHHALTYAILSETAEQMKPAPPFIESSL
jgi:SpoVK/Ycf46/Vps4 family AAA+-type ATPase